MERLNTAQRRELLAAWNEHAGEDLDPYQFDGILDDRHALSRYAGRLAWEVRAFVAGFLAARAK